MHTTQQSKCPYISGSVRSSRRVRLHVFIAQAKFYAHNSLFFFLDVSARGVVLCTQNRKVPTHFDERRTERPPSPSRECVEGLVAAAIFKIVDATTMVCVGGEGILRASFRAPEYIHCTCT